MSFKASSLIQYAFLGVLGYLFVGAPLFTTLFGEVDREVSTHGEVLKNIESLVVPEENLTCPHHGYNINIFSTEPLIIYIESFLSDEEAAHLVKISEPHFEPSTVWTGGEERLDPSVRHSEKARLERDNTVKCIEERARVFQGWRPDVFIERLWSQRYTQNGHYRHHYDWGTSSPSSGRVSSFMVYLEANCTGGGTNFPRLTMPAHKKWCEFVECSPKHDYDGVTFKPVKGNAVFWENFRADGTGYKQSWHAGLPVLSGRKIGLNIWSWYQKGYNLKLAAA
ncbi:hypothetical protein BU16DRAFT_524252 [Lophium mytilinum]|uniref:Prolyl 4-hydroxylase alpha subunit domain-containing protein n=1 Tax=Lophium mytilinum TaxID=390894 RepID=A0A6A6R8P6_9PEZI|nr:hypothetical protein BU16DRAFT_524252 [Lophium mytilinum]